jgi:hypothetical protein
MMPFVPNFRVRNFAVFERRHHRRDLLSLFLNEERFHWVIIVMDLDRQLPPLLWYTDDDLPLFS